jgi:hypothetical protein
VARFHLCIPAHHPQVRPRRLSHHGPRRPPRRRSRTRPRRALRRSGINGKVAVVTGAASGIGRALAYELARRGARLAISDIDDVGLAETAKHARVIGAKVHEQHLDVTDRAAVLAYADTVADEFGAVHLLINNAGIAFTGDIEEMTFEQIERVMDVDFWGVVNGTKAFLPYLIESGDGHVVNISSLFGLLAVPGQSAYNAAKFAVRGFTEALRQEMIVSGHPVQVTCVHPGGIKTAIARNAGAVEGDGGTVNSPRGHRQPAARRGRLGREGPRRVRPAGRPWISASGLDDRQPDATQVRPRLEPRAQDRADQDQRLIARRGARLMA